MYASLVDGTENVTPIGIEKAFYIYTHAMFIYQDPVTGNFMIKNYKFSFL